MKKLIVFIITTILTITFFNSTYLFSSETAQDIKVSLNGKYVQFDEKPAIVESRTIVPMRAIFEALGAKVEWDEKTRTVTVSKENTRVALQIGSKRAYVNNRLVILDVAAIIINGRTFVPVRFISESLGAKVDWDDREKTVIINTNTEPDNTSNHKPTPTPTLASGQEDNTNLGSLMGASSNKVTELFGQPARKDLSKYGFYWYIYNRDYSRYIQIGIDESGKVAGIYTNSENYSIDGNIYVGDPGTSIDFWGDPIQYIKKGNVRYKYDSNNEQELHLINDSFYVTVFFDIHNSGKITAFLLIDKQTELSLKSYYGQPSTELRISYENQIFDLANSVRVRNGKTPFVYDEKLASVARMHSEDMALNGYFSHTNLKGQSPFDRMTQAGLKYSKAAENIAFGQPCAIFAHEGWMNSSGHRANILGDCKALGVGVKVGDEETSITHKTFTPQGDRGRFLDTLIAGVIKFQSKEAGIMPRRARLLCESGIYHIMIRGNEKKNIFIDDEDRARFLEIINDKAQLEEAQIFSYCLMSNHIHVLIMQKNAQISRFMKRVEVTYAYYFNKKYGRIGHLFQDRYKSEAINSNEHLLAAVRYIHKNPVKAGIVKSEGDYEWSSYNAYTRENCEQPGINTEFVLGMFAKERKKAIKLFKEFSRLEGDEKFIDIGIGDEKANREIKGVMASRKAVDDILTSRGLKLEHLRLKPYSETRNEIIALLKRKSDLSIRQMAELLDINRGIIQRIK